MNTNGLKKALSKAYKYVLWGYGYRLFLKTKGYRLLNSSQVSLPGALRILSFHDVPTSEYEAFDRLIRYVRDTHGILTPAEAEARLAGENSGNTNGQIPTLLTFDDGFASNVEVARKVLDSYGIKAIFFICPGLIDIDRHRHREAIVRHIYESCVSEASIPDEMSFMSWQGAESLVQTGHTIGSHTLNHARLKNLNEAEQREEIIGSADRLEARLGVPVNWFAYPFGDLASMDASSVRIASERYRFCCTGLRGLDSIATNRAGLLREPVDLSSPVELQNLVVAGGMDFWHQRKVAQFGKLTA